MKAADLRIGNLIQDKKDREISIQVASLGEGIINYWMESVYQPIPLSEEWLLKFGFREYYGDMRLDIAGGVISRSLGQWYVYGGMGSEEDYGCRVTVEYVHTLQNLYFALTGEELTIKE